MSKKIKFFVEGTEPHHKELMEAYGWEHTNQPEKADVCLFTGGADVDPSLYGHKRHSSVYANEERDKYCVELYHLFNRHLKPMIGVCRGGQFLNIMNGGTMYQDADKHGLYGTHEVIEFDGSNNYQVSSTHHQIMIPNKDRGIVLAAAQQGSRGTRFQPSLVTVNASGCFITEQVPVETEAVWYAGSRSLCFQPHPEYFLGDMDHDCPTLYFRLIEQNVLPHIK